LFFSVLTFSDVFYQNTGKTATYEKTEVMADSTIVMAFRTGSDVNTHQIIFDADANSSPLEPISYYIRGSHLWINADCFAFGGSCDQAEYTIPIDTNTNYVVAVRWNLQNTDGDIPTAYVNGVSATITTQSIGDSAGLDRSSRRGIGDLIFIAPKNPFLGNIAYFTMCGKKLSDSDLKNITGSYLSDIMLQYSSPDYNCLHHYDFVDAQFNNTGEYTIKDRMGSNGPLGKVDVNMSLEPYIGSSGLSRS